MSQPLYYCTHRIAIGDRVTIMPLTVSIYEGVVVELDPERRLVGVRYQDWQDLAGDGSPKEKQCHVPVEDVFLIARAV